MDKRIAETEKISDLYKNLINELPNAIDKYKEVIEKTKDATIKELEEAKKVQDAKLEQYKERELKELVSAEKIVINVQNQVNAINDVTFSVRDNIKSLENKVERLSSVITQSDNEFEKKIHEILSELRSVEEEGDNTKLVQSMEKTRKFLEDASQVDNSPSFMESFKEALRKYNQIAEWMAFPTIPPILIEKKKS